MSDVPATPPQTAPAEPSARPPAATGSVTDAPNRDLMIPRSGVKLLAESLDTIGMMARTVADAGAFAQGQVAVSGNRQAVQHRDGGVVSALHVAEGDTVRQGQILLEVAGGELAATERGLTGQVLALLAQRSRLIAERDRLGAVPVPREFADLPPEDQPLAAEAMRLQRLQFGARGAGRSTERGVLQQRISQLEEQIKGYERQIAANTEQRRLIEEELAGMRSLAAQGYAPMTRVRALERQAAALDGEQGSLRAEVARAREQVGETRLQMLAVGTTMNEDVAEQLRNIDVQLNELQPRLASTRAQIARNQVRAPVSGQVVGLTVFTQGGVIQAGQTLMEIVPADASQIVVAQISPADVDNLRIGLSTEVKFPGLREGNPPIVRGRVTRISADSFTDEANGARYFRAEIVVPESELAKLGVLAGTIRPGSPVEVVVLLRKRTALTYLLEPLTQSLWRSGSEQ